MLLLTLALTFPLAWPAGQGLGRALLAVFADADFGDVSLWPSLRVWALVLQGLALALLVAAVATALAWLCALALLLPQPRAWRWGLAALLAASFCFGTVVHLLAWRVPFPVVTGGAPGWALATVALALRYLPLSVALLAAGLASLERSELETALCTGGAAAVWATARRRLLRLSGMSLAAVAALSFGESELPPLVGVHVYAEEFLAQVALEPSAAVATALGWPLMAVALAAALLLARVPRLRANDAGALRPGWIGHWVHAPPAAAQALRWGALAVAACPLLLLTWGWVSATGRWPANAGAALGSSLGLAGLSAALACAWGGALAAAAHAAGRPVVGVLNVLLWLAMLWPSALTGIALAGSQVATVLGDAAPLVLAHTLRVLPFATWLLLAARDAQPAAPREQLHLLGAHGPAAWTRVLLPAARPALLAAFMLGCGLSLAELTATVLTVPPGVETVILRLYNLLHYGDQRGVMTLALAQGLTVAAVAGLALAWLGGWRARAR